MVKSQDDNAREKLGETLKKAREKQNLTQEEVAEKSGMTTTYYAMIERGEVNPSWAKLTKIFKVLDLKLSIKEK